ncbi:uncharacterized protein CTRU02_210002 [Colletotrichum truncatum]|uniref:Uncharacterized protein n=1 Tax=Colletotrichum truncatum TaxID=5467 RepID=A0ACC3YU63_COLTU|nr:uncharacterized protein CTRU02_02578 [Colletotrichum truncatum]KAF6798604.1 hypothetical protein CTRU02_02578 [Colletotrichum truncatum]
MDHCALSGQERIIMFQVVWGGRELRDTRRLLKPDYADRWFPPAFSDRSQGVRLQVNPAANLAKLISYHGNPRAAVTYFETVKERGLLTASGISLHVTAPSHTTDTSPFL